MSLPSAGVSTNILPRGLALAAFLGAGGCAYSVPPLAEDVDGSAPRADARTPPDSMADSMASHDAGDATKPEAGGDATAPDSSALDVASDAPAEGSSTCAAAPAWKATTSVAAGGTMTSIAIPAPGVAAPGDVLIAYVSMGVPESVSLTASPPPGWTLVGRVDHMKGGISNSLLVYDLALSPGPVPASYVWTLSPATYGNGWILDYEGIDPTHPVDLQATQDDSTTAPYATAALTTTASDELIVTTFTALTTQPITAWSIPTGFTQRAFVPDTGNPLKVASASNDARVQATSVGPVSSEFVGGGQTDLVVTEIVALRPCR